MVSVQSNILIVDDELFFRKLYRDILLDADYHVTVCCGGDEVIRKIRQEQFDLILTDMVMPGKDGLDILRYARTLPNPPDVILVTGHASLESAIDALKNGARDYLVKPFNPEELKHLVETCLEQRRLLTENDQLRRQVQLFQNAQTLSSLIALEDLLSQSLDILMRETGATVGCAVRINPDNIPVVIDLRNTAELETLRAIEALLPEITEQHSFFQSSREFAQNAPMGNWSLEELWLLPLRDGGQLKAVIALCGQPAAFDKSLPEADLRYLCDQIALGFANFCRYQSAKQLMYTDDLTGLYNHRYLQVALNQEIRRSQRYGLEFSLLFLDLDHFKEINDQHGHLAGSAALKEVGFLLRDCVREADTLFRFGGDEFAAILVEADAETARIVAERVRKAIEGHVFLEDRGLRCFVTVTAGFATFPSDATDNELLLNLADRAMYAGKNMRNIICSVADIPDRN